jgi:hypothetical protein
MLRLKIGSHLISPQILILRTYQKEHVQCLVVPIFVIETKSLGCRIINNEDYYIELLHVLVVMDVVVAVSPICTDPSAD